MTCRYRWLVVQLHEFNQMFAVDSNIVMNINARLRLGNPSNSGRKGSGGFEREAIEHFMPKLGEAFGKEIVQIMAGPGGEFLRVAPEADTSRHRIPMLGGQHY